MNIANHASFKTPPASLGSTSLHSLSVLHDPSSHSSILPVPPGGTNMQLSRCFCQAALFTMHLFRHTRNEDGVKSSATRRPSALKLSSCVLLVGGIPWKGLLPCARRRAGHSHAIRRKKIATSRTVGRLPSCWCGTNILVASSNHDASNNAHIYLLKQCKLQLSRR